MNPTMAPKTAAPLSTFSRWAYRLACAAFFFTILYVTVPRALADAREQELYRLYPEVRARGTGRNVHGVCTSDADCGAGSNNNTLCKTLTINYANGSAPYVTRRCQAQFCPSPFPNFVLNGNPRESVESIATRMRARGNATSVTFNVPSPAVNDWDPRRAACIAQERDTAAPCTVP